MLAPWARNGSVGWHASPSRLTRPTDQCSQRFASEHRPFVRDVDGVDDRQHVRMPEREVAAAFLHRAGLRPAFDQPVVALDRGDEVQQLAAAQRVGDDVAMRADPGHAVLLTQPRGQTVHRHDAAPRHEAGEGGARAAEQRLADARMHAIGADQRIAADALAVFEQQCHAVGVLFEVDAARADTHRIGRAFGQCLHQHLMKIAAMHQPVGRAVARDGIGAEVLHAPGLAGVEQPHLLGGRHRGDRLHRRLAGRVRAARASRSARSARRRRVRAVPPPARTAQRRSLVAAAPARRRCRRCRRRRSGCVACPSTLL